VPVPRPQQDRPAPRPLQLGLDALRRLEQHPLVELAAPLVVLLEALGDGAGLLRVARQQQPHPLLGVAHAPGGIDARREHERHLAAGDVPAVQLGDLDQGRESRPVAAVQAIEPEARQHPVLAHQRHDIGDGAEGHRVEERGRPSVTRPRAVGAVAGRRRAEQGLGELVGHPDAGQRRERVLAILAAGVDDRARRRQDGGRLVVVGDDGVDPQPPPALHRLDRGDAAIDGDDQRAAAAVGVVHRAGRQPVTVAGAVRDAVVDRRLELEQRRVEHEGGGDPVHVVVPVDQDALAPIDGTPQSRHRAVEVTQPVGVVEVAGRGVEEASRLVGCFDPAVDQGVGDRRRHGERARQPLGLLGVAAAVVNPQRGYGLDDHNGAGMVRKSLSGGGPGDSAV